MTNNASRHFTLVPTAALAAVVLLLNTALPSSVYEVIPDAALAHPINSAFVYPEPASVTLKPVTWLRPISADAFAWGGDWITISGGLAAEYPLPNALMLISVIWPLKIEATAVAPVPPLVLLSTM